MMRITWCLALCSALCLAACGSVQLPERHFYRLRLPRPSGGGLERGGVLRVGELQLAADLAGDRLMVARGDVRVQAYELHTWAGPLDRMLAETLVAGLSRSGSFARVKSEWERGGEDYLLSGRALEFHQVAESGVWLGRVTLDLGLCDASGRLLFQSEFQSQKSLEENTPEALVIALSDAVDELVAQVLARCEVAGVFEQRPDAEPGR